MEKKYASNAERQAAYRVRQKEKLEKLERRVPGTDAAEVRTLKARISELEAELACTRKRGAAKAQRG
jgi:hypothetical protein